MMLAATNLHKTVISNGLAFKIGRCFSSVTTGSNKIQLGGIYPPLTTPFNADESIAFDKLASNLTKYAEIPFAGYVVQGSNGEYPYLEKEERLQIVKFVKDFIKSSNKPLIAGSGCECKHISVHLFDLFLSKSPIFLAATNATIKLTEEMAHVGADAVMVVTPSYFKASMNVNLK